MNELKFRVWNGSKMEYDIVVGRFGCFYVNPGLNNDGLDPNDTASLNPSNTKYDDAIRVMQLSGLTDKAGSAIYEGDLMRLNGGEVSEVKFDGGSFYCVDNNGDRILNSTAWIKVGNIYENKELLTPNSKLVTN